MEKLKLGRKVEKQDSTSAYQSPTHASADQQHSGGVLNQPPQMHKIKSKVDVGREYLEACSFQSPRAAYALGHCDHTMDVLSHCKPVPGPWQILKVVFQLIWNIDTQSRHCEHIDCSGFSVVHRQGRNQGFGPGWVDVPLASLYMYIVHCLVTRDRFSVAN